MTFAPQCTKHWQLYEQMSRVLKMCEEAGFDRPWECVKCSGRAFPLEGREWPDFQAPPEYYEFALAIVEGRPVFRGDVLVGRRGEYAVLEDGDAYLDADKHSYCIGKDYMRELLSWNPPQRTIEINGVKVKAPYEVRTCVYHTSNGFRYGVEASYGESEADAEAFKAAMEGK